jgi:formylglycine-generating enzyme required for sulfatase activity/pimeloyl-ACP methyl ester carboxylesterase
VSRGKTDREEIFNHAAEIQGPAARAAYLDRVCGEDTELRADIESLLKFDHEAGTFLESPILDTGAGSDGSALTEGPGTVIGRYKLLEKIGEGGMAVVYMAEQTEPIRRKVALKIIKLGMDTRQVIARFEAERQALALMDHPGIAKVFDAGATETGRPYFVMELVRGVSITEYCDRNSLSTGDRLRLFIQVCHAVQHAHQKGIIHRDIKPSNVMVTLRDGGPVPKVIDFGIAKATNQRLTEKTLFTRYSQMIGTPAYMSPEQAQMSAMDVDTRTDIYSLGVLLYELLTGTTPFDARQLQEAGYSEMQRIIRETDPLTPSTKLRSLSPTLVDIARNRSTSPDALRRLVKGDLDWIVAKCLEKNTMRRYDTVHALAEDIERHLRHEPVTAGSPGMVYRLQRFCRRRRVHLAVAALVLVLVIGSVGGALAYLRSLKVRWARQEALPMVSRLVKQRDYPAAFFLAEQVEKYIPEDPILVAVWPEISRSYTVRTDPEQADVYYKEYGDVEGDWLYLGRSPLEGTRFPCGTYRWKIVKNGFEAREAVVGSYSSNPETLEVTLKESDAHSDMVPINSQRCGAFLIDKYEVTNEQYKKFVDQDGYETREYWKHPFVRDGREVPWEEAVREFVDTTGVAGPATWEKGAYPKGQGNFPVSGISWYEAAAYAEFVGMSLPTVSHWYEAASVREASIIIPYSNFGPGPAPVGSHHGMGRNGLYDMAGNVREWCFNAVDDSGSMRYILGGAWTDFEYMFDLRNTVPPWNRSSQNGFRCVRYLGTQGSLPTYLFEPEERRAKRDISQLKPLSDEEFRSYKQLYSYDRTELEAHIESLDESPVYWRKEKITLNAAYGRERVTTYLFIPTQSRPPYQPVVYFPSASAWRESSSENLRDLWAFDFIIQSGRAFIYPVYKSTYERRFEQGPPNAVGTPIAHRNWFVQMYQDFARAIDYLENREDMDLGKLTFLGLSRGAWTGPLWVALEDRIRFAIFAGGGCWIWQDSPMPSADPMRFAAHVKVPTIMLNGRYDAIFPYETSQKPLFELLGTPAEHKVHKTYPSGHPIEGFREEFKREVLEWLDRYLGPVELKGNNTSTTGKEEGGSN